MFNGFQLILKTKYFTLKSPSVSKIINEVNVSIRTDIDPVFSCFNKFWTIFKDIEVQGGPWVKNELFASNCFLIYHLYPLTIRMRNEGLCTKINQGHHRRRKYGGSSPNSLRPISYFGSIWELYVLDLKTNVFL